VVAVSGLFTVTENVMVAVSRVQVPVQSGPGGVDHGAALVPVPVAVVVAASPL